MQKTEATSEQQLAGLLEGLRLVALRHVGDPDEAEDAAQETVKRVLVVLRGSGIPDGYTLPAYAHGILRNVTTDMLRLRGRHAGAALHQLASAEASPLEQLVTHEEKSALQAALKRLPRADRELLQRCYVHGEKISSIARATSEPAERIRKRKSRALERLRLIINSGHTSTEPND